MTTNKPEVKRYDCTSGGSAHYYGCYTMTESEHGEYVSAEDYEALQAECVQLRKDAERLDWLEIEAKRSPTGVAFDYHRYAEDGYVLENGYRFMRRHYRTGFNDSLRRAIDAAMEGGSQ